METQVERLDAFQKKFDFSLDLPQLNGIMGTSVEAISNLIYTGKLLTGSAFYKSFERLGPKAQNYGPIDALIYPMNSVDIQTEANKADRESNPHLEGRKAQVNGLSLGRAIIDAEKSSRTDPMAVHLDISPYNFDKKSFGWL